MHLSKLITGLLTLCAIAAATPTVLAQNTPANTPANTGGGEALTSPTPASITFDGRELFELRSNYEIDRQNTPPSGRREGVETSIREAFRARAAARAEACADGEWRVMADGEQIVAVTRAEAHAHNMADARALAERWARVINEAFTRARAAAGTSGGTTTSPGPSPSNTATPSATPPPHQEPTPPPEAGSADYTMPLLVGIGVVAVLAIVAVLAYTGRTQAGRPARRPESPVGTMQSMRARDAASGQLASDVQQLRGAVRDVVGILSEVSNQVGALAMKLDSIEAHAAQRAAEAQSRLAEHGEALSGLQQEQVRVAASLSAALKEQGDRLDQRLQGIQALISRAGGAAPPSGEPVQHSDGPPAVDGDAKTYRAAGHQIINHAMHNQAGGGPIAAIADLVREASAATRGASQMRESRSDEPELAPLLDQLSERMRQVVRSAYLELGRRVPRELLAAVADADDAQHEVSVTRAARAIGRGAEPVRDSLETTARTITAEALSQAIALRDQGQVASETFGEVLSLLRVQPMPAPAGTPYSPRHHDPLGSQPDQAGELVVERQVAPGYAWRNQVLVRAQVTIRPAGAAETGAEQ